jgi:hypothetical protein
MRSDFPDAHARLGKILLELRDEAAFRSWYFSLPECAKTIPETWTVFGDWALRHGDADGALRCLGEATRLDSTHQRSHHLLGQVLASRGESEDASWFQHRNERLQEYLVAAKQRTTDPSPQSLVRLVSAAEVCCQTWEAWGWGQVLRKRHAEVLNPAQDLQRPSLGTPRVLASCSPDLKIDPF